MGTRLAKISGTLTELSGEELARQQGMPAAPLSPLGAAGIGASQDVAKMAGTGEQVRAALRETLKERTETKDVMAEAERGTERARFDVGRIQQQLQTMTGLGSLDNRVADKIRQNLTKVDTGNIKNAIDEVAVRSVLSKGGTIAPSDADVKAAVTEIAKLQVKATPEEVVKVLSLLGISSSITESTESLAQKLAQTGVFKQSGAAEIKKIMDDNMASQAKLKIGDLAPEQKPFSAAEQDAIEDILDVDDIDTWTLDEVKSALQAYSSRNFANVDELRGVLASPTASQSQKDFARKRLAELGAIGVTSAEEKTNDLQRQMDEGDTVKFGKTQVKIFDLLNKPEYKAIIANALATPEGLAELEKSDPELADWVKKNQARLVDFRKELADGTKEFIDLQKKYNDTLKDTPPDVLDKLVPNWRDAKSNTDVAGWVASLPKSLQSVINEKDGTRKVVKSALLSAIISKRSADYAKDFDQAAFDAITDAANGDQAFAVDLVDSWIKSDTVKTTGFDWTQPAVGTGPDDFTQADSNAIQKKIIKDAGYSYETIADFISDMQRLATSASPLDRKKAVDMFGKLSIIRNGVNNELSTEAVDKIKVTKTADRVTKETKNAIEPLNDILKTMINAINGRAEDNPLRINGNIRLKDFPVQLVQAQKDLVNVLADKLSAADQLKKVTEIQKRISDIKFSMADSFAAFLADEGSLPGDALDAAEIILGTGLISVLPQATINMIRDRIERDQHYNTWDKNHLSSVEKLQKIYEGFGGNKKLEPDKIVSNTGQVG